MTSKHWTTDRADRAKAIEMIGNGNIIKTVVIDRGHKNGAEIHEISDTGIITIYNERTHKMITKLIARPNQIRRYYKENEKIPAGLIELAREHKRMNLNKQEVERLLFLLKKFLKKY